MRSSSIAYRDPRDLFPSTTRTLCTYTAKVPLHIALHSLINNIILLVSTQVRVWVWMWWNIIC